MKIANNKIINLGNHFNALIIITSIISFLAIMSAFAFFFITYLGNSWVTSIKKEMTIRIIHHDKNILSVEKRKIENFIQRNDKIESYKVIDADEARKLLSPYLGEEIPFETLPIPILIEVKLHEINNANILQLKDNINKISKFAVLDDHKKFSSNITKITLSINLISFVSFILIIISCTVICSLSAISALEINRDNVSILHLIGASDDFIANEIQKIFLLICSIGVSIGSFISIFTIFVFEIYLVVVAKILSKSFILPFDKWIYIVMIPLLIVILCAISARHAVSSQLRNKY